MKIEQSKKNKRGSPPRPEQQDKEGSVADWMRMLPGIQPRRSMEIWPIGFGLQVPEMVIRD